MSIRIRLPSATQRRNSKAIVPLRNFDMAIHHKIPRSRGGTDDTWNLVELDDYAHAYEHALDFVLFPEISPMFDFRLPGWKLLPNDLQMECRKEVGRRSRINGGLIKLHREKLPDGRSKAGVENCKKMHAAKTPDGRSKSAYHAKASYRKPIATIDIKTGERMEYESFQTASIITGIPAESLCRAARGRCKTTFGLRVEYLCQS